MGRRQGGRQAQSNGASFESLFFDWCRSSRIAITRIPNSCRRIGPGPRDLIQIKSPFDFVLTYHRFSAVIDTKSTISDTFPYSQINGDQVANLFHHEETGLGAGGYVIWLRKSDKILFVRSSLLRIMMTQVHGSIEESQGIDLGSSFAMNPLKIFT
jgi:hypothetical protein